DDVIAMEQHGDADANGNSADRRDQRLAAIHQRFEKATPARIETAHRLLEEIADVVACAVRPAGAGEHDATDRVARVDVAERAGYLGIHRARQRVLLLRA